ncbi:ATP-binding protein [Chlamydiota bacterium]
MQHVIRVIASALNTVSLYGITHPISQEMIQNAYEKIQQVGELTIGVHENKIIVNDDYFEARIPILESFLKKLMGLSLETVTFKKDLSIGDLTSFLEVIGLPAHDISAEGGIPAILKQKKITSIVIHESYFKKVRKGKKLVEKEETVILEDKITEFYKYLQGKITELGPQGKKVIVSILKNPQKLAKIILKNAKVFEDEMNLTEGECFNAVRGEIKKIGDNLVDESLTNKSHVRQFPKQIDTLKKSLEDEIDKTGTDTLKKNKKRISTLINEYNDQIKVNISIGQYLHKMISVRDAEQEVTALKNTLSEQDMLLPLVQERLKKDGFEEEYYPLMKKILHKPLTEDRQKREVSTLVALLEERLQDFFLKMPKTDDAKKKFVEITVNQIIKEVVFYQDTITQTFSSKLSEITRDKERTELIMKNISDGLVVVDKEGKVLMMNDTAKKLLGTTEKTKLGKSILDGLTEEQMVTLSHEMREKKSGELLTEIEIKSPEDTKKVLRASTGIIQNEEGKTVGFVSVLSDVSKQRELEEMRVSLVNNISDELRGPLTSLKQTVSILSRGMAGKLSDEQKKYLHIANNSLSHMLEKVDTLFDFSAISEKAIALSVESVSLEKIIDEAIENVSLWAHSKKISIEKNVYNKIPSIMGDKDKLLSVFIAIGTNALKFTDQGGKISFLVEYLAQSDEHTGKYIKVSIIDTGIGVSEKNLNTLFSRYHYISSATSLIVKGSGLELPLVKKIVQMHGGKIWVVSDEGKGTTVSVLLPRKEDSNEI